MSYQTRLQQMLSPGGIDRTLAKVGVVACVLLLGLRLVTDEVLLLVIPLAVGTACVLYLSMGTQRAAAYEYPKLPLNVTGYLPTAVFGGLALLIVLTFASGGRTVPVYLLTGAIGSAILAQTILIDDDHLVPGLVLTQIIVAAVVIRLSALFVTPGFIGVDIWTHAPVFVEGIAESGSLSAIAESKYSMAPLYHSIGAIGTLAFGSARMGVYLTVGLLVPLSALFVYGAGTLLVPSRWALLATALFVFGDQAIRWGLHVIPTSLGLVFFVGVLYAVTKLFHTDDWWVIGLLVVCSLAAVFTHQVSTAVVLVFLGVASVAALAMRELDVPGDATPDRSTLAIIETFLLTFGVTIASWMYTPWYGDSPFLWQILETFTTTLSTEAGFLNLASSGTGGPDAGSTGLMAQLVPYIEWFGFAVLLLAVVVGGLAMLHMENPTGTTVTYLVAGASMFVIVFGFSLFGIRTIMPGRWMAFMYAVFAIIGAAGLYTLSRHASSRVMLVVLLLVVAGYPTTMVVAEKATLDSPAFEDEYTRFAYTEAEIGALDTISAIYPAQDERVMASDHPYKSIYGRAGGYSGRVATVEDGRLTSASPMVVRAYQQHGPAQFETAGETAAPVASQSLDSEQVCSSQRNRVYANDVVELCTPSPVTGVGE